MSDLPSAEKVRLPNVDADTNALINGLLAQLHERRLNNVIRTTYYENKRAIHKVGTLIPPQYFRLGICLGWAGKAVDSLARRCNLDGFVWAGGDLGSIGGTDLWDENALGAETDQAILSALQHGPAFLINTVGVDADEPDSLISVKDATEATGNWNRRKRRLDDLLSILERDRNGKILGLALYQYGRTITATRGTSSSAWEVTGQVHGYGMPGEVIAYKPMPKRPFGQSRITRPIMGLQDAAVRGLIRLEGHMDVYSYPEMWMLGADPSIFKNADGTQQTAWEIRLGRIKGIPDDDDASQPRADVKQITASSPEPHLADLNALAKLFAREAQLPDSAVAITDVSNPTSAESYDASQYELIAEAEGATDEFTAPLRRSYIRGLAIKNQTDIDQIPESWKTIETKWRDPRYLARSAEADAGSKILATVPWLADTEVGLELLGLNAQQIRQALADKRRSEGRRLVDQLVSPPAAATETAGVAGVGSP